MENPFESINQKLDRITIILEELISNLALPGIVKVKQVMTIAETANFLGIAKQTLYSYTSKRTIPHYKNGKKLYFIHDELLAWLQTNKRKTVAEITNDNYYHKSSYKAKRNYRS